MKSKNYEASSYEIFSEVAPYILNLGIRCVTVVSFMP